LLRVSLVQNQQCGSN